MNKIIISIIGSAGRLDDAKYMTKERFNNMVKIIDQYISEIGFDKVVLKSGGAAWSDHVAVILSLKYKCDLILCFPCKFENDKFIDNQYGSSANKYHKEFSEKMGYNTLSQITDVLKQNTQVIIGNSFHDRNNYIADCDLCLAFTTSEGDKPEKGGTLDTWNKCKKKKHHISILQL